ncbi:hypothetical protein RFI_24788 [Reticulomyxa filosa]|uniref:Uncharacterized protein n=1 Tax=Reticulomyxa filosa TaxID=46433 RepID=X6MFX5_RETFI|nr:hypothetical protein RFI_24788 [Reticulomyxa filosa]|eukprot:ETO12586.1 hypothetical protein RFI_24788 [Reticulomyxa filosa]
MKKKWSIAPATFRLLSSADKVKSNQNKNNNNDNNKHQSFMKHTRDKQMKKPNSTFYSRKKKNHFTKQQAIKKKITFWTKRNIQDSTNKKKKEKFLSPTNYNQLLLCFKV